MSGIDDYHPVITDAAGALMKPLLHDAVLVSVSVIGDNSLLVFDQRETGKFLELKVECESAPILIATGTVIPAIIFDVKLLKNPTKETLVKESGQESGCALHRVRETYHGTARWFLLFGNSWTREFPRWTRRERRRISAMARE